MADVRCHEHSRTTGIAEECVPCLKLRLEKAEEALCSVGAAARDFHAAWLSRNSKIADYDWRLLMYEKEDVLTDALGLTTTVPAPCPHEEEAKRLRGLLREVMCAVDAAPSETIHWQTDLYMQIKKELGKE